MGSTISFMTPSIAISEHSSRRVSFSHSWQMQCILASPSKRQTRPPFINCLAMQPRQKQWLQSKLRQFSGTWLHYSQAFTSSSYIFNCQLILLLSKPAYSLVKEINNFHMNLVDFLAFPLYPKLQAAFLKLHQRLGTKNQLAISDLPNLNSDLHIPPQEVPLLRVNMNLYRFVFFGTLKSYTLTVILYYTIECAGRNLASLCMGWLIDSVGQQGSAKFQFALYLILFTVVSNAARHISITTSMEFSAKARMLLYNILFNHIIKSDNMQLDEQPILGLAQNHLFMLEYYFMLLFQLFVVPIAFLFGAAILWSKYEGPLGLVPLAIVCSLYPIQLFIQKKTVSLTEKIRGEQQVRQKYSTSYVQSIKTAKMQSLCDYFVKLIQNRRLQEQNLVLKQAIYTSFNTALNAFASIWGSFLFFTILHFGFKKEISAADVLSTLTMMNYFKSNCVQQVSHGLASLLNIKLAFQKLNEQLNTTIVERRRTQSQQNEIKFSLRDLGLRQYVDAQDFTLQPGSLITITGPVGSGKSKFLKELFRGLRKSLPHLTIGYVDQEPFLVNESLAENILFGKQKFPEIFNSVIRAAQLEFDINQMKQKEDTIIGERGCALSGGQRTRVALARAFYALPDIYLLDDPFSALDTDVCRSIYHKGLIDFIQREQAQQTGRQAVIILITHNPTIIELSESLYILENNKLHKQTSGLVSQFQKQSSEQQERVNQAPPKVRESQSTNQQTDTKKNQKQSTLQYLTLNGQMTIMVVALNIAVQLIYNRFYGQIQNLSENQQKFIEMAIICFVALCLNFSKNFLNTYSIINTNTQLHEQALLSISQVSMSYFDQSHSSHITQSLAADLNVADTVLCQAFYDSLELGSQFLISLITILLLYPSFYVSIMVLVIFYANRQIYQIFSPIIAKCKVLDQNQKGDLISLLRTSLEGRTTIQAFEQQERFQTAFRKQSNLCIKANAAFYYAQRVFAIRIDCIGFIFQIACLYLLLQQSERITTQALILLLTFNENQQWCLRQLSALMSSLKSIQNIFELTELPQEPEGGLERRFQDGSVDIQNVNFSYGDQQVLKNLSLSIKDGESVGIVGRTGCGKSSLIAILLRLYEVKSADKLNIGGHDARGHSISGLRQQIGIVPQNGLILPGTLRNNLDPHRRVGEVELLKVCNAMKLDHFRLDDMLDSTISQGQKQLINIARILLEDRRIVIFDEATSSIDLETDTIIQQLIRNQLSSKTIIQIAHRTQSLVNCRQIYEFENGTVKSLSN